MKKSSMKLLPILLTAFVLALPLSCSKSSKDDAALPPSEVADIVSAVNAKDVTKVGATLKTNPKLLKAKSDDGWPLLMIAAKQGSVPLVKLLLDSGADVNEKNYSNEVALDYAALNGHKEVVEMLLAHAADVNVKNDAGATPLTAATSSGHKDIADLLRQHGAKE